MKIRFMFDSTKIIQEEFFTTEYTEFHGGIKDFRTKTPWYSVYSVVNSYFLDHPKGRGYYA